MLRSFSEKIKGKKNGNFVGWLSSGVPCTGPRINNYICLAVFTAPRKGHSDSDSINQQQIGWGWLADYTYPNNIDIILLPKKAQVGQTVVCRM